MARKKEKAQKNDFFTLLVRQELGIRCEKEYRFHPVRKWRFDYALPDFKIALEVEGGVWTQGRHTRPKGFLGDMEKYNAAAAMGWRLIRVTPSDLISMSTLTLLREACDYK